MNPQDLSAPQVPLLKWALTIEANIGEAQVMGESVEGHRSNYPVLGGRFYGVNLIGEVLPGGADFYLLRPDGTGELDASYSLRSESGELINVRNRGLLTLSDLGRELDAQGVWPLPESEYRCRCSPKFQVPMGSLSWLNQDIFIGSVHYSSAGTVLIHCYTLLANISDQEQ